MSSECSEPLLFESCALSPLRVGICCFLGASSQSAPCWLSRGWRGGWLEGRCLPTAGLGFPDTAPWVLLPGLDDWDSDGVLRDPAEWQMVAGLCRF